MENTTLRIKIKDEGLFKLTEKVKTKLLPLHIKLVITLLALHFFSSFHYDFIAHHKMKLFL